MFASALSMMCLSSRLVVQTSAWAVLLTPQMIGVGLRFSCRNRENLREPVEDSRPPNVVGWHDRRHMGAPGARWGRWLERRLSASQGKGEEFTFPCPWWHVAVEPGEWSDHRVVSVARRLLWEQRPEAVFSGREIAHHKGRGKANTADTIRRQACSLGRLGATRCKAPRQPWHSWQSRQRSGRKLQNLQGLAEFESHPLRQLTPPSSSHPACFSPYLDERNSPAKPYSVNTNRRRRRRVTTTLSASSAPHCLSSMPVSQPVSTWECVWGSDRGRALQFDA